MPQYVPKRNVTIKKGKIMFDRTPKLSKIASYLVVSTCFVVAFLVVTDKFEVILAYLGVVLTAAALSFVRNAKQKHFLQIPWQYNFIRFLCIFLPFSIFFGMSPRFQDLSLGEDLVISAIFSGLLWAGIHFQENSKRSESS
ncbi:MAG: hypothetical protein JW892_06430 [Anaerolineae bacterium]|nr:hypothetical protein [Anaerolineae bacterium]